MVHYWTSITPDQRCSRQSNYAFVSIGGQGGGGAVNLRDVQEAVLVLVLLVNAAHEGGSGRQDLIDEDEDGLLGAELDALADNVDELSNGEIGGHQVLLLVDCGDIRLLDLFADDLGHSQPVQK